MEHFLLDRPLRYLSAQTFDAGGHQGEILWRDEDGCISGLEVHRKPQVPMLEGRIH